MQCIFRFSKIFIAQLFTRQYLVRCPNSKESANQRTGRCGRTCPGVCYRMYKEKTFEEDFQEFTVPEILRNNLGKILLMIIIDVPSKELVESCYDFLVLL